MCELIHQISTVKKIHTISNNNLKKRQFYIDLNTRLIIMHSQIKVNNPFYWKIFFLMLTTFEWMNAHYVKSFCFIANDMKMSKYGTAFYDTDQIYILYIEKEIKTNRYIFVYEPNEWMIRLVDRWMICKRAHTHTRIGILWHVDLDSSSKMASWTI